MNKKENLFQIIDNKIQESINEFSTFIIENEVDKNQINNIEEKSLEKYEVELNYLIEDNKENDKKEIHVNKENVKKRDTY